ncbi:alpha/beta fold hydrolase [Bacillus cereus group sp. BfR-BA-01380]|uniref:alpha/beta fold hydrolase n=1 Tax=Bacillus cereus group sp. BfR-BA-01380 TaxID=2920324 RepID=UPI0037C10CB0
MMECLIGDVKVHYEIYGSGKPIIMLHGFTPDHRLMSGCMEPVFSQREGWKRIYIDLPGMGHTKGHESIQNSDGMLDLVLKFIDTIIPNESFLIAGESYGGYITRGVISKRKEKIDGAAFICPMIIPNINKRQLSPHTVIYRDEKFLSKLSNEECENFSSNFVVLNEYNWQRYLEEIISGIQIADEAFLTKIQKQYAFSYDVDSQLSLYEKPSLFVLGKQDSVTGYKDAWDLLDKFPRATFAVLDRAGHNLQIEQDVLFHSLINEWLDRVEEK